MRYKEPLLHVGSARGVGRDCLLHTEEGNAPLLPPTRGRENTVKENTVSAALKDGFFEAVTSRLKAAMKGWRAKVCIESRVQGARWSEAAQLDLSKEGQQQVGLQEVYNSVSEAW